ncbi:MAG TPA: HipA family kinase [Myxococcaceae bacterium]|nr:HipA family kinase [Myxococcaceae bacterium]
MRTVQVTRYVTPLREGGSMPAIVEADDSGLYVLKFRGAGQGPKVLVAELLVGELARAAGLAIPEIVFAELDPVLGRNEPDDEIRDLIKASGGLNLALDYLPGSITFDPVAGTNVDPRVASSIVWLDAYAMNVDRTARNPNLLSWHDQLWLIDHGAALYFHHGWDGWRARMTNPFLAIKDHVLLPSASALEEADAALRGRITPRHIEDAVAKLPDSWLAEEPEVGGPDALRAAYVEFLSRRLEGSQVFVEEARRARAQLV